MTIMEWAQEQCRLYVCNCYDPDEQKYKEACCASALKAYESLINDGHSGMSYGITKDILVKLINGTPLVPVENKPELWIHTGTAYNNGKRVKVYYHAYYKPLSKFVDDDGVVTYSDVNRVVCHDASSPNARVAFTNGFITKKVNEIFPITFPYDTTQTLTACVSEYLTDRKNGDFDTMVLECVIPKRGATRLLNWGYKETEDGWVSINSYELAERIATHRARIADEAAEKDERENI